MVRVKTQDRQQIFLGQLSESDRKTTMARCPDLFIHESLQKSCEIGREIVNVYGIKCWRSIQLIDYRTFSFTKRDTTRGMLVGVCIILPLIS